MTNLHQDRLADGKPRIIAYILFAFREFVNCAKACSFT